MTPTADPDNNTQALEIIGVPIFEPNENSRAMEVLQQRILQIALQASYPVTNPYDFERLFLRPLWRLNRLRLAFRRD